MSQVLKVTEVRRVINHAGDFGRVAVLYGGLSAEREVSLDTGAAAAEGGIGVDEDFHSVRRKSVTRGAAAGSREPGAAAVEAPAAPR